MRNAWARDAAFLAAMLVMAAVVVADPNPSYRQGTSDIPGSGSEVMLPYVFSDLAGNLMRIQMNGWFRQEGRLPLIDEGALLFVNGNSPWKEDHRAHLDPVTGELVVEVQDLGLKVTRRILFNRREGLLRYVDVFQNPQPQAQTLTVSITSKLNAALTTGRFIADARKPEQNVAWIGETNGGQSVVQMYGGAGAAVTTVLDWSQGNNNMTVTAVLTIPSRRELALVHLHKTVPTADAGVAFVNRFKESAILKGIPTAIRKLIVNFPETKSWPGEIELPRSDKFDEVELRNGDRFRGVAKESPFVLQTFHGSLELPSEGVAGVINLGESGARQLLVTTDGQVFAGRLEKRSLDLELPNGQIAPIPFSQVNRLALRKRPGEPDPDEAATSGKLLAVTSGGERMFIKPLKTDVGFSTRYGKLTLKPETVAAISFENDESASHKITLTDGSSLFGLLEGERIEVELETSGQRVAFPVSSLTNLQLVPKMPEIADLSPRMHLTDGDLLVGRLTGKLHIETSFAAIAIEAKDIRLLSRGDGETQDVKVMSWDDTSFSGRLTEMELNCELKSGMAVKVPASLLREYSQPPREEVGKEKGKAAGVTTRPSTVP